MRALACLGFCLLVSGPAASESRTLRLPEALSLARVSNNDIAAARARWTQAQVGIEQAWIALLPTLAAQGRYTHNNRGATIDLSALGAGATAIDVIKLNQLDGSLSLTVPLIVPAAYPLLSAAKHNAKAADFNFDSTQTSILLSVAQTFFAAAGADELVIARINAIEVAKQTVANSQARFDVGTAKKTDVNQARLALLRAEQSLVEAESTRSQAYRSLATLIQLDEPFRVKPESLGEVEQPVQDLVAHGFEVRPELKAYMATSRARESQIASTKWDWAPALSGFGRAAIGNYVGFNGTNGSWALGLQLDWFPFDAGNRRTRRHLVQAQLAENEASYASARDSIRDTVENAYRDVSTKRKALVTAESSATLARETLSLTRAGYEAGTATQLDVLQAQDSLVLAEVGQARARFDWAVAKLSLERAAGYFPEDSP